jgi:dTDP-4-amino-4,6-dideoxygalactose transaminase
MKALGEAGIASAVYYPVPLHLQRAFKDLGYQEGDFPIAEGACLEAMAIPCYPELSLEEQKYIVSTIQAALRTGER